MADEPGTVEATPVADTQPMTREAAAVEIEKQLNAERGDVEAPSTQLPEEEQTPFEAEAQDAPVEDDQDQPEGETADDGSEVEPVATAALPPGMSESDKKAFAQLPPEMQTWVSKRLGDFQADYTRKTQVLAQERNQIVAGREVLVERMQRYDQILAQYTDRKLSPPDPALRDTDPAAFDQQLADYVYSKDQQERAAEERRRNARHHEALTDQHRHESVLGEEQALVAMRSPLAEGQPQAEKLRREVFQYGVKLGIPEQALHGASAIELMVLHKARLYDSGQAARSNVKTVVQAAPKMVKPGPAKAVARPNGTAQILNQIARSGSRDSLAAGYEALLKQERRK